MGGSEDDVSSMASAVAADFGGEALLEAAATVAIFCGLVRVADGTGIQLDEGVLGASEVWRDNAGVNGFDGAANSMHVTPRRENFGGSVLDLFS